MIALLLMLSPNPSVTPEWYASRELSKNALEKQVTESSPQQK